MIVLDRVRRPRFRRRRFWSACLVATALGAGACATGPTAGAMRVDVLIRGGQVYSGALEDPRITDVGVAGDRIVFIGDARKAGLSGEREIDAAGRMVVPGFIDTHVHATEELGSDDRDERLVLRQLAQGVTTSVIGVDGAGEPEIARFIASAEAAGVGQNFASYVGFGAIRRRVLGDDARAPTPAELDRMKALAAQAMCEGALGLSSGLFYAPQSFAATEEVIAVATEAGKRGGLYDTHQRDEGTTSIGVAASTREQIRIGRESGATLHLAHFKVSSGALPDGRSMAELIAIVEEARAAGQDVTADQYPWSASNTGLVAMAIPRWAQDGGREAMLRRFQDPEALGRILTESAAFFRERGGARNVMVNNAPQQPELVGRRISEIAEDWGVTPAEAAVRILTRSSVSVAIFAITEEDIRLLMTRPWVMSSSDGSPRGHPRGHASYPRLYQNYVVDQKVLTPVQFVHRSTGLPADTLRLGARGYIRRNGYADIVVLDPAAYLPRATYIEPTLLSTGVETVLLNGKLVIDGGRPTGVLSGRGLTRTPTPGSCPPP